MVYTGQEFATPAEALAHYGVKGMKWGVRKSDTTIDLNPKTDGVIFKRDGSIEIKKGASLQRLVRSSGSSLPMKDITYASVSDYDNAKYIKVIGGKGVFGGGRDQILGLQATSDIKAPSKQEATAMVSDLMIKNSEFRKRNTSMLNTSISDRELKQLINDPTGKTATAWYDMTNQKLTFDKDFDPDAPYVQRVFRETLQSKGYNAVRDENDVTAKISKAPVIIFSPEKTLKVTTTTMITDDVRKANKEKLKVYKRQGKEWLERELYS